ncbi:MAG: hypothetical protein V1739_05045 [Candidatus Omnitrophota bacterium]
MLFVCVENSCRSQMVEALLNSMQIKEVKAYSAGSRPIGEVNALAKEVMKESRDQYFLLSIQGA